TKCCFFHLGQAVYRRIQDEGLATQYNNEEDRELKTYTHMMLALAYVPVGDVPVICIKSCEMTRRQSWCL
ncbi:hypothetical protein U1Q18_051221, partial [Sarracenia purpurea var. burkii]